MIRCENEALVDSFQVEECVPQGHLKPSQVKLLVPEEKSSYCPLLIKFWFQLQHLDAGLHVYCLGYCQSVLCSVA